MCDKTSIDIYTTRKKKTKKNNSEQMFSYYKTKMACITTDDKHGFLFFDKMDKYYGSQYGTFK